MTFHPSMEPWSSRRYESSTDTLHHASIHHTLLFSAVSRAVLLNIPFFQAQTLKTFTIEALTDSALEGEERFNVRLSPAETDAVIDPLKGQFKG